MQYNTQSVAICIVSFLFHIKSRQFVQSIIQQHQLGNGMKLNKLHVILLLPQGQEDKRSEEEEGRRQET